MCIRDSVQRVLDGTYTALILVRTRPPHRRPPFCTYGGSMRRIALTVIATLAIAACSNDSTSPVADGALIDAFLIGSSSALTSAGGYDGDLYQDRLINGLPDELKLT